MCISKVQKPCINSTRLIHVHGFLLVKTWLLIACDTAFYAMIVVKKVVNYLGLIFQLVYVAKQADLGMACSKTQRQVKAA